MKKKGFTVSVSIIGLAAVLGLLAWHNTPYHHALRFVEQNAAELSTLIDTGRPLPLDLGWQFYNYWDGEHPMTEFILDAKGGTYYGVYYSPDDVPLSFQNAGLPLEEDSEGGWTWETDGNNRGTTQRLQPGWYYFTADF